MLSKDERVLVKKFVQRLPLFKNLTEESISQIIDDFTLVSVGRDETIFYQTDESTDLYIVLKGSVRASLINEEGQELILASFKEGDFFGEMSLLDGRPRSATMIADEDSLLSMLNRRGFLNTLKEEPMIAIELLSALVGRLRMADEMIESLAFLDVSERLVKHLFQIAKNEGERIDKNAYKIKKITHKELAAHTGASREAITKVLKVLSFKNIVQEKEGYFHITVVRPDHLK